MFLSPRTAFIRNLAVAVFNGAISLIILLIAPMGLAGVITNTLLITVASFLNAAFCDRIVIFLQNSGIPPKDQTPLSQSDFIIENPDSSPIKDDFWRNF